MIRGAALLALVTCQRGEPIAHHFVAADGTPRADLRFDLARRFVRFFGDGGLPATIVVDERPGSSKFNPHGNTIRVSTTSSRAGTRARHARIDARRARAPHRWREHARGAGFLDEGFANVMRARRRCRPTSTRRTQRRAAGAPCASQISKCGRRTSATPMRIPTGPRTTSPPRSCSTSSAATARPSSTRCSPRSLPSRSTPARARGARHAKRRRAGVDQIL